MIVQCTAVFPLLEQAPHVVPKGLNGSGHPRFGRLKPVPNPLNDILARGRGGFRGTLKSGQGTVDGDLVGFSNDLPRKYKNNSGKINVTVRRTADSGTTSLKTCEEA